MYLAAKKLPCNHIFHTSCLRSWFQRHQTCPTCRLDILRPTPIIQPSVPITPVTTSAPPTNINNQGPSTSDRPSASGQTGNNNSSYNNEIPRQYQFRHIFQQRPTSIDENNSNTTQNNNSNNGIPQQNDVNETFAAFMNATGLGAGIGLPPFFSKYNLKTILNYG